jgi:hypothetical protein
MLLSYYMLIAGGINEAFLRIDVLRRMVGTHFFANKLIGETHAVVMLSFVVLILGFLIAAVVVKQHRSTRLRAAS